MTHTRSPRIVISGSGLWTPAESITNDELVNSYNAWAAKFNTDHAAAVRHFRGGAAPRRHYPQRARACA